MYPTQRLQRIANRARGARRVACLVCVACLALIAACQPQSKVEGPDADDASAKGDDPRNPEIRTFIQHYFKTWSDADIDAYGACFHPQAAVYFLGPAQAVKRHELQPFLDSQRTFHETSPHPTREVPESIEITHEQRLARVLVRWKLTSKTREKQGYDHFYLLKTDAGWQILTLIFYDLSPNTTP